MASLLNWLGNGTKAVAHTVNNDVLKPVQRDVVAPVAHAAGNVQHAAGNVGHAASNVGHFGVSTAQGVAQPFVSLAKTDIINPTRQLAAQVSHNPVAAQHAQTATYKDLGLGPKGTNFSGGLRHFAGNTAQIGLNVAAPMAGKVIDRSFAAVAPKVVPKLATRAIANAGTGAVVGGAFNGAALVANQDTPLTAKNLRQSITQGAQAGALLGGGATVAPSILRGTAPAARSAANALKKTTTLDTPALRANLKDQQALHDYTDYLSGTYDPAKSPGGHNAVINTGDNVLAKHLNADPAAVRNMNPAQKVDAIGSILDTLGKQRTATKQGGAVSGDSPLLPANKLIAKAADKVKTASATPTRPVLPGSKQAAARTSKPVLAASGGRSVALPSKDRAESNFPLRVMTDERADPIHPTLNKLAMHTVKHNAPVMAEATARVAHNEDAALALAKRGSSTEANATAMQLLHKYLAEGSHEKASDLLQSISPRFTRQGQETQILAEYSKLDPVGAVRYATKEVDRAAAKSANGAKVEDKTVETHKAVRQTAKDVANQVSEEVRTNKIRTASSEKTPEELLANRIKAPSDRRAPNASDPVKDMVNTLHKVAKQAIPDAEKRLPRDPMQLVGAAVKGKAEYAGIYEKAKALVMDKYKDNPQATAELEKYFGSDARKAYADSQLRQGMSQGLKGENLSKLVKEHYTKVDETGQELKQKLIERAGLSESEATSLSGDIQRRYDQLIKTKKDSVIKQIFGEKPKPEQIQLADRILQFHNLGAMSRDELRPLVANKLGLKTLSPEASKTISDMAAHIQTLAEGTQERHQATANMMKFIAEQKPQSALDNTVGIYKAGLLSGVKTQEGNALSNLTFGALKKVSDIPASIVDAGLATAGKTRIGKKIGLSGERQLTSTLRGEFAGGSQGLSKARKIMRGNPDFNLGDKYEQHAEINLKSKALQTVFGKPANLVFRGMQAADQPWRYAALKNSLYDQAYAVGKNEGLSGSALKARAEQLVQNPSERMAETAAREAKKAVLDFDTYASRGIQAIHQGIDRFAENGGSPAGAKAANAVVNILAPFVRVPSAFISRTIDFTPLGIGKEIGHQLFTKTFNQRALSQAIGEGLTGAGVIALGIHLSKQGLISGDYPKNDVKEQQRWKTEGITPNSVYIGPKGHGRWVSLNYGGPVGLLFNAGKKIADAKGESTYNQAGQAVAGLGQGLLGQSFLQGFNGFSNAVQDPTKIGSYANSEASSVIPAWVNDIGNASDRLQRQADNPLEAIKGRLPGIRTQNNPKQDVYGNSLPNQSYGINAINGLKPSNDLTVSNPVTTEVNRLHNVDPNNSDLQVTPTPVGKSITIPAAIKGEKATTIPLNDKQRYALQKQVGQTTQDNWNKLIKTPEYQAMTDTEKAKQLTGLRQDATELATRQYVIDNNLGTYAKAASKSAAALAGGDMSKYTSASGTTSSTADLYKSSDAEYKALQTKYDKQAKAGFNSPAQQITMQRDLAKAQVGAKYDKAIRDAYNLSNAELYDYVSNDPNGKAIVAKVLDYSQALKDAGITSNAKFKNKYGQVTLGSTSSSSTGTRRTGKRSARIKTTIPKQVKFKTAKFSTGKLKAPTFKTKRATIPKNVAKTPKVAVKKKALV